MLASSHQASQRTTAQFIHQVEDIIQHKIHTKNQHPKTISITPKTTAGENKYSGRLTVHDMQKHEKKLSNFETRSSMGQGDWV